MSIRPLHDRVIVKRKEVETKSFFFQAEDGIRDQLV